MDGTVRDVLAFVRENDVRFIRLGFCDPMGAHKNISVMPDELEVAFGDGISFDASAIRCFQDVTRSDLKLMPDPATLTALPWRPGPGRVIRFYCDILNPDGSPFACDGRAILKRVAERFDRLGLSCQIGAECEFYLFKLDEDGEPTHVTLDKGGYLDIAPLDKGENVRREICLYLTEMGIMPECSHHEQGPGQNEIDFKFSGPLSCADHLMSFKSAVKAIAARNGLFASFMPKPLANAPGSGLHVNLSLARQGRNLFRGEHPEDVALTRRFIAGILAGAAEISLFLNPTANSYERLGRFEAPKYLSWSHQNRSQLIRIPAAAGDRARMELRSPDPSINPYLAFALILAAGLHGIEADLALPDSVDADLYAADESVTARLHRLPEDLAEAAEMTEDSALVRAVVGDALLAKYVALKRAEAAAYAAAPDKAAFCRDTYFPVL